MDVVLIAGGGNLRGDSTFSGDSYWTPEPGNAMSNGPQLQARVVAVHGIGQQRSGSNELHQAWWPSINDGLDRARHPRLTSDELSVAFYGDLFRPKGKMSLGDPPFDASDVKDDWEIEFLDAMWREASVTDSDVTPADAKVMVAVPRAVQRALNALSHSRFFAGIAERALIFDLKQVRAYLNDDAIRQEACERVVNEIGSETRVLIGHSLGSVVAYEALCDHPEWPVRTFVTIGSPLGIRNLIFERLRPAPSNGHGALPGSVTRWFNIADSGDVVALVKKLRPLFGEIITDNAVSNGATAHDARPYLTSQEVGAGVATGLRE